MARIKHIALTTSNPSEVAAFYKEALGLEEVRKHEKRRHLPDRRLH